MRAGSGVSLLSPPFRLPLRNAMRELISVRSGIRVAKVTAFEYALQSRDCDMSLDF